MPLGDRHADRVAESLTERAGRGLDAGRLEVFRMSRRVRPELAEALDLVERHRLVAGEIEQRIEQHRAVAGREHEAVAVGPLRVGRIEFQELREQDGRDVGRAHRQAGMAGLRLLDRVHRERTDGVRHAVVLGAALRHGFGFAHCGGRRIYRVSLSYSGWITREPGQSNAGPKTSVDCLERCEWGDFPRFERRGGTKPAHPGSSRTSRAHRSGVEEHMNGIIYLVGLIVVIMFILSFLGLR